MPFKNTVVWFFEICQKGAPLCLLPQGNNDYYVAAISNSQSAARTFKAHNVQYWTI